MLRKKRVANYFFVAAQNSSAEIGGAPGLAAKLFKLKEYFPLRSLQGAGKRRIKFLEWLPQAFEQARKFLFIGGELRGQTLGQMLPGHLVPELLPPTNDLRKRK